MADTIAVMNAGRIEQLGDPATLYERPRSTFVANFLGQSNLLRADRVTGARRATARRRVPTVARPRARGRRRGHAARGHRGGLARACARRSCGSARAAGPTGCAASCTDVSFTGVATQYLVRDAVGPASSPSSSRTTARPGPPSARTSRCPGPRRTSFVLDASQDADAGASWSRSSSWLRLAVASTGAPAAPPTPPPGAAQLGALRPARSRACCGSSSSSSLPMVTLGVAVPAGGQRRRRLRLHRQRRHLRRRAVSSYWPQLVRSLGLRRRPPPCSPCCSATRWPTSSRRRPGGWKNVLLVLVIAPFFTSFLIRTLAWQTILSDDGLVTHVRPASSSITDLLQRRRPHRQRLAAFVAVRGDLRPDLQLPAVHDPAALRLARAARPPARRGGRRPLRLAVADVPAASPGRCRCPASWPARC